MHPAAIGRRIVVSADLDRVRATCDGSLVADHERLWAKHQTISDLKHLVAAKMLRRGRVDLVRPPAQTEVEIRPDAHGGEGRIRAARFPARKSLEEFDSTTPAASNAT